MKKEALRNILPLGSVITEERAKKLMIIGRIQEERSSGIPYDYAVVCCIRKAYWMPELYMFQGEDIDRIYHASGRRRKRNSPFAAIWNKSLKN